MFGTSINETLIRQIIDAMSSSGLHSTGFQYVNLDDGWQRYSGARGNRSLEPDPEKFPSGIKALADYAHEKGFKMGIYTGPGEVTCAGYTASGGHEVEDAEMFASWGIDHLKYDSCCEYSNSPTKVVQEVVLKMSEALLATKRPIVYHACHCGWNDIWQWAASEGANQWRIGQDISDDYNYPGNRQGYYFDVLDMLDRGKDLARYAGPGHWNDYDMLVVGLDGMSTQLVGTGQSNVEYRAHYSMWAMVCSPLLIGADVRNLDQDSLETLLNKEIADINQDPLGKQAVVIHDGTLQVYTKQMVDGSYAVALLNRQGETRNISVSPEDFKWTKARVRDLWKHTEEGAFADNYEVEVIPHEAKILRLWEA